MFAAGQWARRVLGYVVAAAVGGAIFGIFRGTKIGRDVRSSDRRCISRPVPLEPPRCQLSHSLGLIRAPAESTDLASPVAIEQEVLHASNPDLGVRGLPLLDQTICEVEGTGPLLSGNPVHQDTPST